MKKIICMCLFLASNAWAENSHLTGRIIDKQNKGLAEVVVKIKNTNNQTVSDASGNFTLENLNYGMFELDIEISNTQHYHTSIQHDGTPAIINVDALSLDNLVISAIPLEHGLLDMTTPAAIMSEDELIINRSMSIDQTINKITGVNSANFGNGAGQIVIRGQQGPRVTVLNNNQTVQDASRVSPDHWITTEPLLAKQIEVLKGPATLLYGGGAIGGVVNVVDDVIPTTKTQGINGALEGRLSDSALDERAAVLSLDFGISDQWMGHVSHFNSETNDYEIPGFAESEILHAAEGHDDDEEEEEEAQFGVLDNTSIDSDGSNFGLSWVNDKGFWGASYSDFNRDYGIPGHSHAHEEHHEDEDESEGEGEEGEEDVRLILDKSVFTFKGAHKFDGSPYIQQLKTHYSDTDYRHVEFEGNENGTVFDNQANEFRLEFTHSILSGFNGIAGIQYTNRDFSAIGDEAFIPPSETEIWSLFLIEEREFNGWHGEFGLRYEEQNVETSLFRDIDDQAFSISLGAAVKLTDRWTLPINLTSAQRLPTAEEYFSNQSGADELITHLATSLIEIGDLELTHEVANNLDLGIRYRSEQVRFDLALFYNQIDDFIFLRNTGTFFEETPIFEYDQRNANFTGYEVNFEYLLDLNANQQWRFKLFADGTRAELNTNEPVPRIPADRLGIGVNWSKDAWSVGLNHIHVREQNDLALLELPTEGYDWLDFNINWLYQGSSIETLIFLKGDNLLDEEIRDHASFIKDIAPRPGRSITAGFRMFF